MRFPLLALTAFIVFASSAWAADKTWTGQGGGATWGEPANWSGGAPVAGDALIFPNVSKKTATNSGFGPGTAFGPLTLDAGGYVLSGDQVALNGGIFLNGANSAQVALPLQLSAPLAFSVSNNSGILTQTLTISGTGGVIKSGSGLLILNGTHTYTGPTIIMGGGLQVGGTVPGVVQINQGDLVGTGTVAGITSLNQGIARVAPGTSSALGTLTSNGDVRLYAADSLHFDVTSTAYDKLVVNGAVNLGGAGFSPTLQSGYTPAVGTAFLLIDNDGTDPIVYDAANPSDYLTSIFLLNGQRFQISLVGGTGHNDVVMKKVAAGNTTVSFTTSNASVAYGAPVTFTVMLTGVVNGSPVSFWDGNEYLDTVNVIGTQVQLLNFTTLKPGVRKITAMFEGNGSYAPVRSAVINQTVTGTATGTSLVVTPSGTSNPGDLVTMVATVSGGSPTGTVTFYDAGVTLGTIAVSTNQAVFATNALVAGVHSLTATYNPTGAFVASSTVSATTHTVNGTATTTALITSATPVVAGADVTFTATVNGGTPTGSVVFRDGAVTLGTVALTGPSAALTMSGLSAGTHSITALYLGSTAEEPSASSALIQVITAHPDGSSSGGGTTEESGGCGLGGGSATLILSLMLLVGLRLRRG